MCACHARLVARYHLGSFALGLDKRQPYESDLKVRSMDSRLASYFLGYQGVVPMYKRAVCPSLKRVVLNTQPHHHHTHTHTHTHTHAHTKIKITHRCPFSCGAPGSRRRRLSTATPSCPSTWRPPSSSSQGSRSSASSACRQLRSTSKCFRRACATCSRPTAHLLARAPSTPAVVHISQAASARH